MIKLKYKKLRPNETFILPSKRIKDADLDIFCSQPFRIESNSILPVVTNLAIGFPDGWEGKVEEKSGLALNRGIQVMGGVIDNMYTGELIIILKNNLDVPFHAEAGTKIAQLKVRPVTPPIEWEEVTSFEETERSDKGFGSTGA